jgi:ABC-type branched-subunit amino acid transport system substrate-binding protein
VRSSFRRAYEQTFNQQPQTACAVYAYDGMKMLGDALKNAKGEGREPIGFAGGS